MDALANQPREKAGIGLKEIASDPDADPCDVACEALPAHVAGDLSARDERWLHIHTANCRYCANELRRYDQLDEALEACCRFDESALQPPPLAIPRRERVWYTTMDEPGGRFDPRRDR